MNQRRIRVNQRPTPHAHLALIRARKALAGIRRGVYAAKPRQ